MWVCHPRPSGGPFPPPPVPRIAAGGVTEQQPTETLNEVAECPVVSDVVVNAIRMCLAIPSSRSSVAGLAMHQGGISIEVSNRLWLLGFAGKIAPSKFTWIRIVCGVSDEAGPAETLLQIRSNEQRTVAYPNSPACAIASQAGPYVLEMSHMGHEGTFLAALETSASHSTPEVLGKWSVIGGEAEVISRCPFFWV